MQAEGYRLGREAGLGNFLSGHQGPACRLLPALLDFTGPFPPSTAARSPSTSLTVPLTCPRQVAPCSLLP